MVIYWVHSCEGYLISNDSKFYLRLEDAIDQYFREIAGWYNLYHEQGLMQTDFEEYCKTQKPRLIQHFENHSYTSVETYDNVSVWLEKVHTEYEEEDE